MFSGSMPVFTHYSTVLCTELLAVEKLILVFIVSDRKLLTVEIGSVEEVGEFSKTFRTSILV